MEKVLLKSDGSIQWKAVFAMAMSSLIVSVILLWEANQLTNWDVHIYPTVGFCFLALAFYFSSKWIKESRRQSIMVGVIYASAMIIFHLLISHGEFTLSNLVAYFFRIVLCVFIMQELGKYVDNKLFAYFIPFTIIFWLQILIQNSFIEARSYPISDFIDLRSILQAFAPLPIAMWLMAMLKVRFVFLRNKEEDEVINKLEAGPYLNKSAAFEELRNTSSLSEKQLAKIFTTVPDPNFRDETKIINTFLSMVLLGSAFYKMSTLSNEISLFNIYQPIDITIISFLYLGFFFFKLTLPYFIYTFRPWAYWVVIIISLIAASLPVYRIYKILDYLSYYRPDLDRNQLWITLGSITLHLILAIIAIRILRKLFSTYRPFYLKKNNEGKYEL